jgi:hypothetical protein
MMTPIDQFIHWLENFHPISPAYEEFLRGRVHVLHVKARKDILPPNHRQSVFCFVATGLIYSWRANTEDARTPIYFARENQSIGTVRHPLYPEHIPDGITCLENSILVVGETSLAVDAVARFEEARDLIDIVVNGAYRNVEKLHLARHLHPGHERYKSLETLAPEQFKRVPQGLLAAYLNISRSQFSYIKSKRRKNGS